MVEDDREIRQLNTKLLLQSGYEVDAAEDCVAAWEALNYDRYDLLITGNNMPKVSGVALLKKLHAARVALPVILVSGARPTAELNQYPWLEIDAVKEVLRATDDDRKQSAPRQNWQSQPSAVDSQL